MHIEHARPALLVEIAKGPSCDSVRPDPEIGAAADRKIHSQEPGCGHRYLDNLAVRFGGDLVAETIGLYHPVAIVESGIDARIVLIAVLGQDIERPVGIPDN